MLTRDTKVEIRGDHESPFSPIHHILDSISRDLKTDGVLHPRRFVTLKLLV